MVDGEVSVRPGARPDQFLTHYAVNFSSVEIDATFYGIPTAKQVAGWAERTPEGFTFAAKIPRSVTHSDGPESLTDLDSFLTVMRGLGPKLGPLVFQFPTSKGRRPDEYARGDFFRARIATIASPSRDTVGSSAQRAMGRAAASRSFAFPRGGSAFSDYYRRPHVCIEAGRSGDSRLPYRRFLGHHKEGQRSGGKVKCGSRRTGSARRKWNGAGIRRFGR